MIDGGKGLHKAIQNTFGKDVWIQRCQVHKKRNVLAHLPKSEKANVGLKISLAYMEFEYAKAKARLMELHAKLKHMCP